METSKIYRQAEADRAELKLKIIEEGMGSGLKWNQIATSAMADNAAAKTACADLLGHPATMLDLYNIMSASYDCMTYGESEAVCAKDRRNLNAGRSAAENATPYLGNRLAMLRKAAGLTQKELAMRAKMPVVTLQKLENGVNSVLRARTETTAALAKALGIQIEDLISEKDMPTDHK